MLVQGLGREDNFEDKVLGISGDLDPQLADLLLDQLEGISPRAQGSVTASPFWDGGPGVGANSSTSQSSKMSQLSRVSLPESKRAELPAGTHNGADKDAFDDVDPAELLTSHEGSLDHADDLAAQPDQLPTNLQISAGTPDADAHIRLIDYEYAGVNPIAYDLANHWCEYGADYHTDTPHVLDYTKFPDHQHQAGFVHAYIETVVSMSKASGDKLSWAGEEISYSAPAPGAMQIHTDTDCNQSLFSKDAVNIPVQQRASAKQGLLAEASSSAPPKSDVPLQVKFMQDLTPSPDEITSSMYTDYVTYFHCHVHCVVFAHSPL